MITGKPLTALVGGLKPEIIVTAKAGALLNLHYKDSSIILQSYQLGESETQHTFVVSVSETAYVVEDVTNSASVEVLVDTVARYSVEISYVLWLYKDGDEFPDATGGWSTPTVASSLGYLDTSFDSCSVTKEKLGNGLKITGYRTAVGGGVSHFFGSFYSNNRINVSGYSTIKLNLKCTCNQNYFNLVSSVYNNVPVGQVHGGWVKANQINLPSGTNVERTLALDVSNLDSSYYVSIIFSEFSSSQVSSGNGSVLVDSIWLE